MSWTTASWRSSWLFPAGVGLLLLAAAGLKSLYSLPKSFPFSSMWLAMGIVSLETLLGFWLVSGILPGWARVAALGLFGGFAVFNLKQVIAGRVSCACFGPVTLEPWGALTLDIASIVLLVTWKPPALILGRFTGLATAILLALPPCVSGVWASSFSIQGDFPLEVSPRTLSLGTVPQAGQASSSFTIHNRSSAIIHISHVETSCPCAEVLLPRRDLAPGDEMTGQLVLDVAKEPAFTGVLGIEITARMPDDQVAFRVLAEAKVESDPSTQSVGSR